MRSSALVGAFNECPLPKVNLTHLFCLYINILMKERGRLCASLNSDADKMTNVFSAIIIVVSVKK